MPEPFVRALSSLLRHPGPKTSPFISDFNIEIHSETRVLRLPPERLLVTYPATLQTSEGGRERSDLGTACVSECFGRDALSHPGFPECQS